MFNYLREALTPSSISEVVTTKTEWAIIRLRVFLPYLVKNIHWRFLENFFFFLKKTCYANFQDSTVFNSSLYKARYVPRIGEFTHAWPKTTNNNGAAVLNQLLHAKLATWMMQVCDMVT